MAQFFPTRNACLPRMTSGERRLGERLEKKLEDDYLVWYDVPVGPKALHPDFVILHPQRGFLVLEVKDWKLETIQSLDRGVAQLLTSRGLVKEKNPMTQARVYALEVCMLLQTDPALVGAAGSRTQGKLIMPWGWGVVLANITRKQFESTDLGEVLEPGRVICQDEMLESVDDEGFQQRLWDMFHVAFPCRLTLPQIDRVRWHLYPEVRVNTDPGQFGLFDEDDSASIPDIIKVMDLQQEQMARSMGEGHRIIHGAAGTGKTMILGYRCVRIAQATSKPILVLCYNKSLAARLSQVIEDKQIANKVVVRNFHTWCSDMHKAFHIPYPDNSLPVGKKMAQMVQNTMDGVDRGQIPRAQYGAVLIDEGHDFEPDWFKLVVQMIDPQTNSLLVLYDDAQSIYRKGPVMNFSFASVGIQAKGRTTILRLNYRNTLEVLSVAQRFAEELLAERGAEDDSIPTIAPESAGRRGPWPELIRCDSEWAEWDCVLARVFNELDHGRSLNDIAVLYRTTAQAKKIEQVLKSKGLAVASTASSRGKAALYDDAEAIKLVSMHSSKGLEFGCVIIPCLGEMPRPKEDEQDEAKLLYVAMTRAMDKLIMTYREHSVFSRRIQASINALQHELSGAQDGRVA